MLSKKIEYFTTLAECLSFTQTASKYNVTQTAISQYIASLEERLEVRLFDRTQHSVSLTEAGSFYYEKVLEMQRMYDDTLTTLHTIASGYRGNLKVGVGTYEYCSTESFFSAFLSAHPEIKVDILQFPYSTLTEKLRSGELDIIIGNALCEDAFAKREFCSRTLFESTNYIVADHATADQYVGQDLSEILKNECLITNCESNGPSSIDMLRKLLIDQFGFVPRDISITNSVNAQLMLVRAGHGVAIVPDFVIDAQCSDLVRYPLPCPQRFRYQLLYLTSNTNPASKIMFDFAPEQK